MPMQACIGRQVSATHLHQHAPIPLLDPALLTSINVTAIVNFQVDMRSRAATSLHGSAQNSTNITKKQTAGTEVMTPMLMRGPSPALAGPASVMQGLHQELQQLVGGKEPPVHPETGPASGPRSLGGSKLTDTQLHACTFFALGVLCAGTQHNDPSVVSDSKNLSQLWKTDC